MTAEIADLWLFDLGNSRLKFASYRAGALGPTVFIDHDGTSLATGWEHALPGRIDAACIASVAAPAVTCALVGALSARCDRVDVARTVSACAGMRIAYAHPDRLGVDRFLALLAVHARAVAPALIVGVGTALTVDLLDRDGLHRGGRIAPSPTFMREMLHARAPHLPAGGGIYVEFGSDTADALASGCDGAAVGLIQRSHDAATLLLGTAPRVLLHGGGAAALQSLMPQALTIPALVLEGLAHWTRARV